MGRLTRYWKFDRRKKRIEEAQRIIAEDRAAYERTQQERMSLADAEHQAIKEARDKIYVHLCFVKNILGHT